MQGKKAVEIRITGRVHGVGFRSTTHQMATRLGLTGFVRNAGVNEVEIFAEGQEEDLRKLIKFLNKSPGNINIENTIICWKRYSGNFPRFTIKYQIS